ncbi:MAG: 2,3-bisphosphoglycerate-independent phosphoglycerate mutase [Chloroflexi bacterium]|nr:2,3-bisphosphoglycerate-independent phosphoglycerate mutase [Chloroflexota bacterium]
MDRFQIFQELAVSTPSRIVLLVLDGLGGLPHPQWGKTELEMAHKPNLDQLAGRSSCGLIDLVSSGVTPGSGPGHLALFGYDPSRYIIGRGVLEGLGVDFPLQGSDVAARGNFCTINKEGLVIDRRAGRIDTEQNVRLCSLLREIRIPGVEIFVEPVKEHRFVLVLRGPGLSSDISGTDPQKTGLPPLLAMPLIPQARSTAAIVQSLVSQAGQILADHYPVNMIMLRGFSQYPALPTMKEIYRLNPAAVAVYPMYRGLARLVGMKLLTTGETVAEQFRCLAENFAHHDFFFVHVKRTDQAGEDGNFAAKVAAIEEVDRHLPELLSLNPDVLIVTGDHSTPSLLKGHSWHPVPFLLHSQWCFPDRVEEFSEMGCGQGILGRFPAVEIMSLAMANALKLNKFGA